MKIEYLDDISDGGKYKQVVSDNLVRIYDFDMEQACLLRDVIYKTIIADKKNLDLTSLDFVQPVNCNLLFVLTTEDVGISITDKQYFICGLTSKGYEDMIQLIAPFCEEDLNGYEWLYELDTEIDLLFSPGGTW